MIKGKTIVALAAIFYYLSFDYESGHQLSTRTFPLDLNKIRCQKEKAHSLVGKRCNYLQPGQYEGKPKYHRFQCLSPEDDPTGKKYIACSADGYWTTRTYKCMGNFGDNLCQTIHEEYAVGGPQVSDGLKKRGLSWTNPRNNIGVTKAEGSYVFGAYCVNKQNRGLQLSTLSTTGGDIYSHADCDIKHESSRCLPNFNGVQRCRITPEKYRNKGDEYHYQWFPARQCAENQECVPLRGKSGRRYAMCRVMDYKKPRALH